MGIGMGSGVQSGINISLTNHNSNSNSHHSNHANSAEKLTGGTTSAAITAGAGVTVNSNAVSSRNTISNQIHNVHSSGNAKEANSHKSSSTKNTNNANSASSTTHDALVNALSGGKSHAKSTRHDVSGSSSNRGTHLNRNTNVNTRLVQNGDSLDHHNHHDAGGMGSSSTNGMNATKPTMQVVWGVEHKKTQQPQQQQLHTQSASNDSQTNMREQEPQPQLQSNEKPNSQSNTSSSLETSLPLGLSSNEHGKTQDQVEFMKKLAKEKAAKMRQEEENRIQQQKERAALRLKELELKMAKNSNHNTNVAHYQHQQKQDGVPVKAQVPRRTLYDPSSSATSQSYSSLAGNNNDVSSSSNNGIGNEHVHVHGSNVSGSGNGNTNGTANRMNINGRDSSLSFHHQSHQPPILETPTPPIPMIHLSSYEDRDRGMMRNASAGPRMLFDPKSGSMVAAPSRDESHSSGNGDKNGSSNHERERRGVSHKGKREKGKSKSSRNSRKDLDSGGSNPSNDSDGLDGKGSKLRGKSKKDKRKDEKKGSSNLNHEKRSKGSNSSANERTSNNHGKKVRLPRTKGVLYKRDEKGHVVSADGCEGDQGYGAHSVPGGKVRNPKGYATHKRKLQNENDQLAVNYPDAIGNQGFAGWHQHYDYTGPSMKMEYDSIPTKTLNRSHFMRKINSPKQTATQTEDEIDLNVPSPLRVKADEKLELLTGMDESPTLQATAAAWAPSQAALALAKAHANQNYERDGNSKSSDDVCESEVHAINAMSIVDNNGHGHDDYDDNDDENISLQYGLGFDPTKEMNNITMTPDIIRSDATGSEAAKIADIASFKPDTSSNSKNPFAADTLLGPSPWGSNVPNSVSMGALSNWDFLSKESISLTGLHGDTNFLSGTGIKGNTGELSPSIKDNTRAKSFLSLGGLHGDTNTWGTGGFSTFNGINETSFGSENSHGSMG